MDKLIQVCLGILSNYDNTVNSVRSGWAVTLIDRACDADTEAMAENFLIAVLLDKTGALLPDDEGRQKEILDSAEGLEDALGTLPDPCPLLMTALVGYAIALSQSRWGWIAWQAVRNAILDAKEEEIER